MLYDAYVKKVSRWAEKRDAVLKYKVLIIIVLSVILAALAGFIATKGMLLGDMQFSSEVIYGNNPTPSAKAFFGEPYYEYAAAGSDAWSEEYPRGVGNYKVRAVTERSFGIKSYSNEFAFVIKPVTASVTASENEITFGSMPTAVGNLQYEDKIQSADFELSSTTVGESTAKAIASSIKVVDKNGNDITAAYVFETPEKSLQIVQKVITITLDDATKEYDGTPLVCKTYQNFDDQLLDGHKGQITVTGERVDAGVTMNSVATFTVYNGSEDVTENYSFTTVGGTLTVTPRQLSIRTGEISKEYNGKALSTDVYFILSGKLLRNHGIKVEQRTEVVDAGVYDNVLDLMVCDKNNKNADVSANYSISFQYGKLTVSPRRITIMPTPQEREYDGTPLSTADTTFVSSSLVKGHNIVIETTGSITDVGSVTNDITKHTVFDGETDVTANYEVKYQSSTLTVKPRAIIVKPLDVIREYDATPLRGDTPELTTGSLVDGHRMEIVTNGKITNVGVRANKITSYKIFDGETDVTANYSVVVRSGSLIVTKRAITITAASNSKVYDATPITDSGYSVTEGSVVEGQVLTVTVVGTQTNAGQAVNKITSWRITTELYENVSQNYSVTLVDGTLTVERRPITVKADDKQRIYDGTPLYAPGYSLEEGTLVTGHRFRDVTTDGSQTNVGSSLNSIASMEIVDSSNAVVTKNYDITFVDGTLTVTHRLITVKPTGGNKIYDGTALVSSNVAIVSAEQPVLDHRVVLVTNSELAGSYGYTECTPYVITGSGDTSPNTNYKVTVIEGVELIISKFEVMIKPQNAEKVYDGTPLTSNTPELVSPEAIPEGHTIEITTAGSITDVYFRANSTTPTAYTNRITSVIIKNAKGEDVTNSFEVTRQVGTLFISPRPIALKPQDEVKEYDGTALMGSTPEITEGSLADGQTVAIITNGSQTEIGSSSNYITDIIIRDSSQKDVTKNYNVTLSSGTLTVTKRALLIAPESVEKMYDGTALVPSDIIVIGGTLMDGHQISFMLSGSRTDAGTSPSVIVEGSVSIMAGGADVTSLYDVQCLEGTVTVTPRPITVVFGANSKTYDGEVFYCENYAITSQLKPLDGHTLSIATLSADAGEYAADGYIISVMADGLNKSANYAITHESNITITKRAIKFIVTDAQKVFDGQRLQTTELTATDGTSLVEGHMVAAVTYGTNPASYTFGSTENPFVILIFKLLENGGIPTPIDLSNNYDISVQGTPKLTINYRSIIVKLEDTTKLYDGTSMFDASGFVVEDTEIPENKLAENHILVHENIGGSNVGIYSNISKNGLKVLDTNGVDVTEYYQIVTVGNRFTVEVVPMPITVNVSDTQKYYDGTADFDTLNAGFVSEETPMFEGHRIVFLGIDSNIGTQTMYTDNYKIYDAEGNDITSNYSPTFSASSFELETVQREITIRPSTVSRPYNGQPLYGSAKADVTSVIQLLEGHTITVETEGSQTEVGDGVLTITKYTITDANGNDVTGNYKVTCEEGVARIMRMNLILATSSASAVFTGEKLSCRGVTIFMGSLFEGHTIYDDEAVYAEVGNIGTYSNSVNGIKIHDAEGNDVTDLYYMVSYKYGTLTILDPKA